MPGITNMHDFFYHGMWRMDWGLGNPNKTAALIAMLMIAVWLFAYIRKWGFWIALLLFTGLGIALIHTFSRGGIIALFCGLIPLIVFAQRPWPWNKIIGITLSIWIMVGFSIYLDATGRYEQGIIKEDRSISNRFEVWKAGPQMMVDAPYGWGIGKSGISYMEWYQPVNRSEEYRTLVNSHLTWLVEFGWSLRFLYLLSWASILLLCWPSHGLRLLAIPLGVWVAFAISATFSSVAESPWLWLAPVLCLMMAITLRFKNKIWPQLKMWSLPFVLSGATLILFCLLGSRGTEIKAIQNGIVLGGGDPAIWIVVDRKVMGQNYGRTIRTYLSLSQSREESIGIVESPRNLPSLTNKTVVLAGMMPSSDLSKIGLSSEKKVILLNPSFLPQEINITEKYNSNIVVIFGEFSQSRAASAWESLGSVKHIPGAGDFLPHWPELIFAIK